MADQDYDIQVVTTGIRKLEDTEVVLCLLSLLVPFQLRLEALQTMEGELAKQELAKLAEDLQALLKELRDRLLP